MRPHKFIPGGKQGQCRFGHRCGHLFYHKIHIRPPAWQAKLYPIGGTPCKTPPNTPAAG